MDFACLSSAGHEKIASLMRNISFFLTKTIMEKQLCELLKQAFQNPEGSPERDRAAEALSLVVEQLPEIQFPKIISYIDRNLLKHYDKAIQKVSQNLRRNIYNFPQTYKLNIEAINCQQLDDCQLVRKKFVNYTILILKRRCIDIYRQSKTKKNEHQVISFEESKDNNFEQKKIPKLYEIEYYLEQQQQKQIKENEQKKKLKKIGEKLKDFIETDPNNSLKRCHPRNNKDGNCQILAQLLLLSNPPIKIKEIAQRINVPEQTIHDRWKNYCKPLLQKIARELGYE